MSRWLTRLGIGERTQLARSRLDQLSHVQPHADVRRVDRDYMRSSGDRVFQAEKLSSAIMRALDASITPSR